MKSITLKSKTLLIYLIIIFVIAVLYNVYQAKIMVIPSFTRCYKYSPGEKNCYTINEKGYWIKPPVNSDEHYLPDDKAYDQYR